MLLLCICGQCSKNWYNTLHVAWCNFDYCTVVLMYFVNIFQWSCVRIECRGRQHCCKNRSLLTVCIFSVVKLNYSFVCNILNNTASLASTFWNRLSPVVTSSHCWCKFCGHWCLQRQYHPKIPNVTDCRSLFLSQEVTLVEYNNCTVSIATWTHPT